MVKSLGDLRKTVSAFASAFARTVGEDARGDVDVRAQLDRLAVANRASDTSAIRREAQATIAVVGQSLERRGQRHKAQLAELSTHVHTLTEQLQEAKRAGEIDGLTGACPTARASTRCSHAPRSSPPSASSPRA